MMEATEKINIEEIVKKEYPNAKSGDKVTEKYLAYLEKKYGSDLDKMLFATSLCSDDINVSTDFTKVLKRPFTMGGLGGLPCSGITGMVAFGHHIPDEGDAFIFYGPHIGITDEGTLGKMKRPGQQKESNSCGALMLALNRMKRENTYIPIGLDCDHQQIQLERTVMPYKERILKAENQEKEITEVTYENINRQIHFLIDKARDEFLTERIFLLGGIVINTSQDYHDFVDVRNFEVLDIKKGESTISETISSLEPFEF